MARVGETEGNTAMEGNWSDAWGETPGDDVLAAALEETEAKASKLDLENARLRLSLVLFACAINHDIQLHRPRHALQIHNPTAESIQSHSCQWRNADQNARIFPQPKQNCNKLLAAAWRVITASGCCGRKSLCNEALYVGSLRIAGEGRGRAAGDT